MIKEFLKILSQWIFNKFAALALLSEEAYCEPLSYFQTPLNADCFFLEQVDNETLSEKNQELAPPLVMDKILESSQEEKAFSSPLCFCYFNPPKGWEIALSAVPSSHVKMAFVKKNKKEGFCPSLSLAIENVEGGLNDYLKDVRAIYEQDRKNHWRQLGKVSTLAGEAQLTEIDTTSNLGSVRMLQLILLKEGNAYIVTAAALKKDFSRYYRDFQEAFHSLIITQDLFEPIPQLERREALKLEQKKLIAMKKETKDLIPNEKFEKDHWHPFRKKIIEECEDMGSFWQALVLTEAQNRLR